MFYIQKSDIEMSTVPKIITLHIQNNKSSSISRYRYIINNIRSSLHAKLGFHNMNNILQQHNISKSNESCEVLNTTSENQYDVIFLFLYFDIFRAARQMHRCTMLIIMSLAYTLIIVTFIKNYLSMDL